MRIRTLVPVAVAACLALTACGSDDDGGSTSASSAATSSSTATAADNALSLVTAENGDRVELTAGGSPRPGVTTIEFRNDGRRPHDAQLIRVEGEHSQEEVVRAFDITGRGGPIPDWLFAGGGVGEIAPGETATVVQRLEPGTYWVFDTSTAGGEGEGKPNYKAGGLTRVDVAGEESTAQAPAGEATVTAEDFRFTAEGLRAGEVKIDFVNDGREIHHLLAFPLLEGRTEADVRRALASDRAAPPFDFRSGVGTAAIEGGTEQQVTLDFRRSGRYVLICFISNRAGGPPHAVMGMVNEVEVQ